MIPTHMDADAGTGNEEGADDEATASEPTPRKSRNGLWLVVGILAACAVVAVIVKLNESSPASRGRSDTRPIVPAGSTPNVVYTVDGTATSASLTMSTPTGTTQIDADLPLMNKAGELGLHFTFDPGSFVYISAQNDGDGEVTCHITVDGVEVSANTASGAYQIASCEGTS